MLTVKPSRYAVNKGTHVKSEKVECCGGGDRCCGGGHGGRSGSHPHGNYQILVAVAVVGIAIFIIVLVRVIEVFVNVVVRVVIKIVAGVDSRCAAGRALNRSGSSLIGPKSIT